MANKSVKSDKEIEEIIYESGICVRGMIMNGKSESQMHQMIDVSEEYRQKMFDECKRHFLQENGVANGDTTKPNWKNADPFDASILDSVTRKSVESTLMKSGNTLVKRSSVSGSSVDMKI